MAPGSVLGEQPLLKTTTCEMMHVLNFREVHVFNLYVTNNKSKWHVSSRIPSMFKALKSLQKLEFVSK